MELWLKAQHTAPAWIGSVPFVVIAAVGLVAVLPIVKPELWQ